MRKLAILFLFFGFYSQAQIVKTAGVTYTTGVPVYTPSPLGSELAVDTASGVLYMYNRGETTWYASNPIEIGGGVGAPVHVPSYNRPRFYLTGEHIVYFWTGVAWVKVSGLTTEIQTEIDTKAELSHTHALGDVTQSGATTGQVPKWSGSAWVPANDSSGTSLPAGVNTNTLRHNGSTWVADTFMLNTGSGLTLNKSNSTGTPLSVLLSQGASGKFSILQHSYSATGGQNSLFAINSASAGSNHGLVISNNGNSATSGPRINFIRRRGTLVAPSAAVLNDLIGRFDFRVRTSSGADAAGVSYFGAVYTDTTFQGASIFFRASTVDFNRVSFVSHTNGFVGIGNMGTISAITAPTRDLDVVGEMRVTDLTTTPPTVLVGADVDGVFSSVSAGAGLALSAGSIVLSPSVISPATLTANENDYAPTGFAAAGLVRLSSDASRNITSFSASGVTAGLTKIVSNVGSFNVVLKAEDVAGTAANRIAAASDYTLLPNTSILIYYDSVSTRWRIID